MRPLWRAVGRRCRHLRFSTPIMRFGNAAGLVIPHQVNTPLVEGQAFKVGDLISYNEGFFEPDVLNPKSVTWKA